MEDFVKLQIENLFTAYKNKETITKEDIEQIQKRLNMIEEQTYELGIELSDEEKESIKKEFEEVILSKLSSQVEKVEDKASTLTAGDESFDELDRKFDEIETNNEVIVEPVIEDANDENLDIEEGLPTELLDDLSYTPINVNVFHKIGDRIKSYKLYKKVALGVAGVGTIAATVALIATGCSNKKDENKTPEESKITSESLIDDSNLGTAKVEEIYEPVQIEVEKTLDPSKSFDVNENKEVVSHLTNFIVDAMSKGIAVKDCMTEEQIVAAEKNGVNFVTISQLMDYYYVMNIEDIDPVDYARLGYNSKTTDTIMNNYFACANQFMDDLLTVKEDTIISYEEIISDKESASSVQTFANYVAKLNESNNKVETTKEIKNYIIENYVEKYDDLYSVSANEQVYRFMFSFDELTNGKGIPNDVNIILNEDHSYTCTSTKKVGEKNKSEASQDRTDMRNIINEKLEVSRNFYVQDLSLVPEMEQKDGIALELEIRDSVMDLNPEFVQNPEYKPVVEITKSNKKTSTNTVVSTEKASQVTGDNGKQIAQSELDKYPTINQTLPVEEQKKQYEEAVKKDFEIQAIISDTHTITNNQGDVVASGIEANAVSYNNGYSAGYSDGNKNKPCNPSGDTSYVSGYIQGWNDGYSNRVEFDKNYVVPNESTHYEDVTDTVVETTTTNESYNDYTYDEHKNDSYYDVTESNNVETTTTFVPVEEEVVETYETESETVTFEDYKAEPESVNVQYLVRNEQRNNELSKLQQAKIELQKYLMQMEQIANEVANRGKSK